MSPYSKRTTWTDCEEAGDYVKPNVLSPRGLVSRPDNMDITVLHTCPEGQLLCASIWTKPVFKKSHSFLHTEACLINFI